MKQKKKNDREKLYIAYGSNLNLKQTAHRCPTAKVVGTAMLHNWRLAFYSVATVERYRGGKVPVLIWKITPQDERALDRYEGYPHLYRKETLRVTVNGKRVYAMSYIVNVKKGNYSLRSDSYLETIHRGYLGADFDQEILLEAVEASRGEEQE